MVIEFLVGSVIHEWARKLFKTKRKNNVSKIRELKNTSNDVKTVGELVNILNNFADDVPLGSSYRWYHVQVLEIDGKGSLHIGQVQSYPSK